MALPAWRYMAAAGVALAIALYVTLFARGSHDIYDFGLWIDVTEWPATLLYLLAAWAAWDIAPRRAAGLALVGMIAFYAAQTRWLFEVPLGFGVVTVLTLCMMLLLPPKWEGK